MAQRRAETYEVDTIIIDQPALPVVLTPSAVNSFSFFTTQTKGRPFNKK
jgi:hypothetical protein